MNRPAPKNPKLMSREEILRTVLAVNPQLQVGDETPEAMSEHLLESIRESRGPRSFSEEKLAAVFEAMLGELQERAQVSLGDIDATDAALTDQEKAIRERIRERLVDFLVATNPGPLDDTTKEILRGASAFLGKLGSSIFELNQRVRKKSSEI